MSLIHHYAEHILVKAGLNLTPSAGTQYGTGVDTLAAGGPFRRAALVIDAVTGAATTVTVKVQDSPDNATWTDVTASSNPATPQPASTAESVYVTNIDLAKRQRYLRAALVGTGTAGSVAADFHFFSGANAAPTQDNAVLSV